MELTGYSKIDAVIRQAHGFGLAVEITDTGAEGIGQISLEITVPVDARDDDNMLGMVNRATSLHVTWTWAKGNGRTPRLTTARAYGWSEARDLTKTQRRKVGEFAYTTTAYNNISSHLYVMGNAAKRYLEEA